MYNSLLLFGFFLLVSISNYAQDSTLTRREKRRIKGIEYAKMNDQYKSAGLVFSQTGVQDQRMTSLIFNGFGVGLDLQNLRYGDKSASELELNGNYHLTSSKVTPDEYLHLSRFEINYAYGRNLKISAGKLYLGAAINQSVAFRFYPILGNNSLGFDYHASFSPSAVWIKEKWLGKNLILVAQTSFNVLSFTLRYPEFSYAGTEYQFLPVGKYNQFNMEIGIAPKLLHSEENRFYVGYVFDAYSVGSSNDNKRLSNYTNGIKIAYWLKTK